MNSEYLGPKCGIISDLIHHGMETPGKPFPLCDSKVLLPGHVHVKVQT
jgi:hypothetical protein